VTIDGRPMLELSERELRAIRWEQVAYVPQGAMVSLDPVYTVGEQLTETVTAHRSDTSGAAALRRAREVLDVVDIDPSRIDSYPHQLSGGMRQRVLLAMALILDPDLVIADEPTTGLDVLVRDAILGDLERYRDEFGIAVLLISHDIADLVETADELAVMYGGKLMEYGSSDDLFDAPGHPYTIGLKQSLPTLGVAPDDLVSMRMESPDPRSFQSGCRFEPGCPFAVDECETAHPDFRSLDTGTSVACYRHDDAATFREQAAEVTWSDE
ncbi:MAG: ABC transporter ATP-binding protein, partial [Halobacteriota archaeon]